MIELSDNYVMIIVYQLLTGYGIRVEIMHSYELMTLYLINTFSYR